MDVTVQVALVGAFSSIVVGLLSYVGVSKTNRIGFEKIQNEMNTQIALIELKLDSAVDQITKVTNTVTDLDKKTDILEEKIKVANKRIADNEDDIKEMQRK